MEHENGDIEFYDGEQPPDNHSEGPSLHHFRSSNFKSEEKYLEECWEKCLRLGVTLPIKVLRIEDEHGNMNVVPWAYGKEKIRGAERNLPDFFGLCPTTPEKFFEETN